MKHFLLCCMTLFILAITFDLALEFDHWRGVGFNEPLYRMISIILVVVPISLWLTQLSCVLRWQATGEAQLLQTYGTSPLHLVLGPFLSMMLIVLLWFVVKEGFWRPMEVPVDEKQVLYLEVEGGHALLERSSLSLSSVWIQAQDREGLYPELLYVKGKGWKLKEDARMNDAKRKKMFEALFDKALPNPSMLDLRFGALESLSIQQLWSLEHPRATKHVLLKRLGLPVFALLWLAGTMSLLLFQKGLALWKKWSFSFLGFVILLGLVEVMGS